MPTTITAHEQPISRIFSDEYVFKIPSYQRPYAWTTVQAGDLIDDLLSFISAHPGRVVEDMPPYFLGSVVLIKNEAVPDAEVVDGQQRLTTLTLLLSSIRSNVGQKDATDITKLLYESGSQILGTQDRFRLSLRERDREFFQNYVQREDGFANLLNLGSLPSDIQDNLKRNAVLFHGQLQSLTETERLILAQFIVTRCFLVTVSTPDLDSAYRIFSVLNSRGLDLSATDILKAEVIGAIPQRQRDAYTTKWENTEEDLGRDDFGILFSHIRMIYRKSKPQGTLLKEFKDHVIGQNSSVTLIDKIVVPMAQSYAEISDAAYQSTERADNVNGYLKWLNRLEFNDWVPPAIAFSIRYRGQSEQMENFFADLERLAYMMLITRAGINERIERFSKLTRAIEADEDLHLNNSVLQLSAEEKQKTHSTLSGSIYESLAARARSTVVLRLDSLLSGGGASYDYSTITVEHVLPQNPEPNSEWTVWFSDPTLREILTHKLGNLALLTRKKNSAASNYAFQRKKEAYFAHGGISPFVLTTQVLNHSTWTPEILEARQLELVAVLDDHWKLHQNQPQQVS